MDKIVENEFNEFNISEEYDLNIFYDFYSEIILTLFSEAQINVNVRIISQNDDELYKIINETDSSIIVKANTFDKE